MHATTISQHDKEIHENARLWKEKPLLREIYADYYAQITRRIDRSIPGEILEIGSGIGNLKNASDRLYYFRPVSKSVAGSD